MACWWLPRTMTRLPPHLATMRARRLSWWLRWWWLTMVLINDDYNQCYEKELRNSLAGGFFTRDSRYYCTKCYQVRRHHRHHRQHLHNHCHTHYHLQLSQSSTFQTNFGTKCAKCNLFVEGEVVSALGNTFHQVTVLDIDFYLFTFFSSLTRNMFPPPGLFHVRAMQTTFSNRRASYFYWEELSLSGLHTGGGIVIVVTIIIIMAA